MLASLLLTLAPSSVIAGGGAGPVIRSVSPSAARTGERVNISGVGFGLDPDDLCIAVLVGGRMIPLRVVTASDTMIEAVVGVVPFDAEGPVVLQRGVGGRFDANPVGDLIPGEQAWIWSRERELLEARSPEPLTLQAVEPNETTRWFFGEEPDGSALVVLDGDWIAGSTIEISAHLHDTSPNFAVAHDLRIGGIRVDQDGSLVECAEQLCELIRQLFESANVVLGCVVRQVGPASVGILVELEIGSVRRGGIDICVTAPPVDPDPVLDRFQPPSGGPGTEIRVGGRNLEAELDDISLVVVSNGQVAPIQVTQVDPDLVGGILQPFGGIDSKPLPNWQPGPIQYSRGRGEIGTVKPILPNVEVPVPVWAWTRDPVGAPQAETATDFDPVVEGPLGEGVECFFSASPTDGELCLFLDGDWNPGSDLEIGLSARNPELGIGYDMRAPLVRIADGGTGIECARRICEVVRLAFEQQLGVMDVRCSAEEQDDGRVKLTVNLLDAAGALVPITRGFFSVCVAPLPDRPLRIVDFNPKEGTTGTEITIIGENMIPPPCDWADVCVAILGAEREIVPLDVVSGRHLDENGTDEIIARIGALPNDFVLQKPVEFIVSRGAGQFIMPDGVPVESWIWSATADGEQATADDGFLLIPPAKPVPCYGASLVDAELLLDLPPPAFWAPNSVFDIRLKYETAAMNSAIALHIPGCVTEDGQNPGEMICNAIDSGLAVVGATVDCEVSVLPNGDLRVKVANPPGIPAITHGGLMVGIDPAPTPIPIITDFNPKRIVDPSQMIVVEGRNFPTDPNSVCIGIQSPADNRFIPLGVNEIDPNRIVIPPPECPLPFDFEGHIVLTLGDGTKGAVKPIEPGIQLTEPISAWTRRPARGPIAASEDQLFVQAMDMPGALTLASEGPIGGEIVLDVGIPPQWGVDCRVDLNLGMFEGRSGIGHCLRARGLLVRGGESPADWMGRVCHVITEALAQLVDVAVECEVVENGGFKMVIGFPGGPVTQGFAILQVTESPRDAPVITGFDPVEGGEGTTIRIVGRNFGDDPAAISTVIEFEDDTVHPIHILEATDTELMGFLTSTPLESKPIQMWEASPIRLAMGIGTRAVPGKPMPIGRIDPISTWSRIPTDGATALSADQFLPIHGQTREGRACFFAGAPRDGTLSLFLRGNWEAESDFEVSVHVRDETTGENHELYAPSQVIPESRSVEECAENICTLIRIAFAENDIAVECSTEPAGDGVVEIKLGLPDGRISKGWFSVCVSPEPTTPETPVVETFGPREGGVGDLITIRGSGFGDDPDDLAVALRLNGTTVPMPVIETKDGELIAKMGAIKAVLGKPVPFSKPGPIHVARGVGMSGVMKPTGKILTWEAPVKAWQSSGVPTTASMELFQPTGFVKPIDFVKPVDPIVGGAGGIVAEEQPVGCFFGEVEDGKVCLTLRGDWPAGSEASFAFQAHSEPEGTRVAAEASRVRFDGGGAAGCADAIAEGIQWIFMQQVDSGPIAWEIEDLGDEAVKLTISLKDGSDIDWGTLDVCIFPPSDGGGLVLPGDCNADGAINIADPICLLGFLFGGGRDEVFCGEPGEPEPDPDDRLLLDYNGDGGTPDIADAVGQLLFLFGDGKPHALGEECRIFRTCPDACP